MQVTPLQAESTSPNALSDKPDAPTLAPLAALETCKPLTPAAPVVWAQEPPMHRKVPDHPDLSGDFFLMDFGEMGLGWTDLGKWAWVGRICGNEPGFDGFCEIRAADLRDLVK